MNWKTLGTLSTGIGGAWYLYKLYKQNQEKKQNEQIDRILSERKDAAKHAEQAKERELKVDRLVEEIEPIFARFSDEMESFCFGAVYFDVKSQLMEDPSVFASKPESSAESNAESQADSIAESTTASKVKNLLFLHDMPYKSPAINAMQERYANFQWDKQDIQRVLVYGQEMFDRVLAAKPFRQEIVELRDSVSNIIQEYKECDKDTRRLIDQLTNHLCEIQIKSYQKRSIDEAQKSEKQSDEANHSKIQSDVPQEALEIRNKVILEVALKNIARYTRAANTLASDAKWRYEDLFNPGLMLPVQVCMMKHLHAFFDIEIPQNFTTALEKLATAAVEEYRVKRHCGYYCCARTYYPSSLGNIYAQICSYIGQKYAKILCEHSSLQALESYIEQADVSR